MMPSWIEPTMAIAPMHTVSEAVTKALTKPASFALPVFCFSHSPKRSKPCSMPIISPMTVPIVRHSTTSIDLPLVIAPASIFNMPSIAPAMAMNMVLTPQARFSASCCSGLMNRRNSQPITPPATMLPLLMIVPSPIIWVPFFLR